MRRLLPFVIALAACGKVNTLSDAPQGDGNGADSASSIDAAVDADPHGAITVIVNDLNPPTTPLQGIPVVFVNPDGSIVAEVATDANGKASAVILPGATVTAVYNAGNTSVQLETVREVAPGDTITIGPQYAARSGSGSFTVNVPEHAGDLTYDVYGPCGSSSANAQGSGFDTPVALAFTDDCKQSAMDLLAIGQNSDHNPDGWLEQKNVAYTDGGSSTMPKAWQAFHALDVSLSNTANTGVIDVRVTAPDAFGYAVEAYATLGTDPATVSFDVPGPATALVMTNVANGGAGGGQQQMYEVVDGTKTTYSVDLATALLPFIGQSTFDPAAGTIDVPNGGGGGDILQVTASYGRVINDKNTSWTWEIWSPPADTITLPPLPADLAREAPALGDSENAGANLYGADAITDWSQVRGQLFSAFAAYYNGRTAIGQRFIWSYSTGVGLRGRAGRQRAARIRR